MVEKRKVVEIIWYLAVLLSLAYIIVAIVAASRLDKSLTPANSKPTGFAVIWSMVLLLCVIVGGTVTMRKLQTPIAVGVFLGATLVFSQLELMLFAIFATRVPNAATEAEAASDRAVALFSFVLAVLYGSFSVLLFIFRAEIPEAGGSLGGGDDNTYA